MLHPPKVSKILVFLPEAAGATIVARLSDHGFQSVCVSTVPEAFDALRSDEFVFAITSRPDIDLLRNIRVLPVINLEVFFHADISSDGRRVNAKRFDNKAFFERVQFLATPVPATRSVMATGHVTPLTTGAKHTFRWWTIAANALRSHSRKDTMDVPF